MGLSTLHATVVAVLAALAAMISLGTAAAGEPTSQVLSVGVNHTMEATLYTPDGPGPFPTAIVLHTSSGISEADRSYCENLARQGFICIVPAFLRAYGIKGQTRRLTFTEDRQPIMADMREIADDLSHQPKAKPGAVGCVGFSNGGFFCLLLAARGDIKAGVSYYGALNGARAFPDLKPFDNTFTASSSPVLVLAGESDTTIGMEPVRKLEAILKERGSRYELRTYPDTEHDFDRSNSRPGNTAAAADAWSRTLAFLRANLQ